MSHSKERSQKTCLNCSAQLYGRYCHVCGQENIEPKESFWGLVSHFFYDITHFDGKFFNSVKVLIARPGLLSKEYISGRRARYLHPIRMYVFSSALFFLIFFSLANVNSLHINWTDKGRPFDSTDINKVKTKVLAHVYTYQDSMALIRAFGSDNEKWMRYYRDSVRNRNNRAIYDDYGSVEQYDSLQRSYPPAKRDGWFNRMVTRRLIDINYRYHEDKQKLLEEVIEKLFHSFPYMLFVSLPLYALYLKLLYIRRRKQFFYVDHVIFLIHLYIFTFVVLLVYTGLLELRSVISGIWLGLLEAAVIIYGIYYTFRAMHKFYGQGVGKTFLKFILLNILCFISILILFSLFFVLTIFRI